MALLLGLFSLVALSLFLSRALSRSASLMPLVAVALCGVWFTLAGCVGLLRMGGWVWYVLCFGAFGWLIYKEGAGVVQRITPGLLFFLLGGVFFIGLYGATQPMLSAWDEFTFWGTAAKVTSETNQLYTVASSSLIARTYPPSLIVFNYAMQFFGSFSEAGLVVSFTLVYLAAFAGVAAPLDRRWAASGLLLGSAFLLPLLFEVVPAAGGISWAYVTCYGDPALAAVFGGAVVLALCGGKRDGRALFALSVVLAFLVGIKDMGFALALLVWLVLVADMLFASREQTTLWRQKGGRAVVLFAAALALAVVAAYLVWAVHLALAPGEVNRFDYGNEAKGALGPLDVVLGGLLALVGIGRTEQFSVVLGEMLRALYNRPVWLLGSGVRMLVLIVLLLAFTWLLCRTRAQRRRVVVFAASSALGFAAFYIFNIFTYAFVFSWVEASVLKDYDRYIYPYWMGWLLGALCLLGATAASEEGRSAWRTWLARLTLAGVSVCMVGTVLLRTNLQANFLRISPSQYTVRWDVQALVAEARAEGMRAGQRVYVVNQYDDGTRFYMLGYEMDAIRVPLYAGEQTLDDGSVVLSAGGATSWLRSEGEEAGLYGVEGSPALLSAFLAQSECSHLLIDEIDDKFYAAYGGMFEGGLAGYEPDGTRRDGVRYWRIEYGADGLAHFTPEGGEGA